MDYNGNDAKTKPLISSLKPKKVVEEDEEERNLSEEEDDDDESKRLLSPRNGGDPKTRRKVQWNDSNGKKLAEVVEFQPSDVSDSDDDDSDSCFCTIM